MSEVFASGKHALRLCDICGFRFKYAKLKLVYNKDTSKNLYACRSCWDPSHPQLRVGDIDTKDPQALRDPRPDPSLEQSRTIAVDDVPLATALGVYQQLDI